MTVLKVVMLSTSIDNSTTPIFLLFKLFTFAEKHNKVILYEAAIAGGIPIITPIKTILSGNNLAIF